MAYTSRVGEHDDRDTEEKGHRQRRKASYGQRYVCESDDSAADLVAPRIDVASHRRELEENLGGVPSASLIQTVDALERVFRETGLDRLVVYRSASKNFNRHGLSDLNMWYPADVLEHFTTQLHRFVNPDVEIPTIDVQTQEEGPMFSVQDLQRYFQTPVEKRKQMLNIVSFNLGLTDLQGFVIPPSIVRDLDLVRRVWPPRHAVSRCAPHQHRQTAKTDTTHNQYHHHIWNPFAFLYDDEGRTNVYAAPETMTYLLLGPAGAYTDWHVDMGGSSVWYHVIQGKKVFMAAPDTQRNIDMFLEWSSSEEQALFLGTRLEGCVRAVLQPGDTLFLPGGWLHAVSTPVDSIVVGGNYINPLRLERALHVVDVEKSLHIGREAMYPKYDMLMYYAACDFIRRIEYSNHQSMMCDTRKMLTQHEEQGLPHLVAYLETLVGSLVKKAATRRASASSFKAHVDTCVSHMDIVIGMLKKYLMGSANKRRRV